MRTAIVTMLVVLATPAFAGWIGGPPGPLPPLPLTQSINCRRDGAEACERLRALRNLYPGTRGVPSLCHFSLVADCSFPGCVPPYVAEHLALVCCTDRDFGGGCSTLRWIDGKAGGGVVFKRD